MPVAVNMNIARLRHIIREELTRCRLDEKKVMPSQASKKGLALFIGSARDGMRCYMLYDPKAFVRLAAESYEAGDALGVESSDVLPAVKAAFFVVPKKKGHPWGAAAVASASAEQGYGPLMYDIIMAREGGLMADRWSVRPAAKNVWQYYLDNRSDVEALPIDDRTDPKTPTRKDDGVVHPGEEKNPLNYVYRIKRKPNIDKLIVNHGEVKRMLRKFKLNNRAMEDIAHDFFDKKYNKSRW